MTKWTYMTVQFITRGLGDDAKAADVEATLNQHGEQGWELVSSTLYHNKEVDEDVVLLVFKKPAE